MRRSSAIVVASGLVVAGALTPLPAGAGPTPTPAPEVTAAVVASSSTYRALRPVRIVDTRDRLGGSAVPARGVRNLQVAGRGGIPADAAAVVVNVTVVPRATGAMTVYPAGQPRPATSNLNFVAGRAAGNQVVVPPGAGGALSFASSAAERTDVIVDVEGYFQAGPAVPGGFVPLPAARVMDTRTGLGGTTPRARSTVELQLTGRGGVPVGGVSAVMLNVTAAYPRRAGHLDVYPTGTTDPKTSTLNFRPRAAVPNFALAKVGPDGKVVIANRSSGSTPVVVDVAGYVLAGTPTTQGAYVALPPTRMGDSRTRYNMVGPVGPKDTRGVRGSLPIPDGLLPVAAYAVTVTATNSTAPSFLAVRPNADVTTSTVQHRPGLTASGAAFGRSMSTYNRAGTADLIIDLSGYFLGADRTIAGRGILTGRVTAENSDDPLPLTTVLVYDEGPWLGDTFPVARTATDSDGRYTIDRLPGSYAVCVDRAPGLEIPYRFECYENRIWCGDACNPPPQTAVLPVTAGGVTRVDLSLAPR